MVSESLLSCISPFLRHLRNQWPRISLRDHSRSSIFGTNRKRVYIFLLVANSNLDPILHRFRDTAALMSKIDNFPYPTPIPAKIWECSLWSRFVMLGSAESENVRLISREIIFAEFQPIWSRYLNVTDGQTDGRTDRQLALAIPASRGKNQSSLFRRRKK